LLERDAEAGGELGVGEVTAGGGGGWLIASAR
jgi:hypothetical protein